MMAMYYVPMLCLVRACSHSLLPLLGHTHARSDDAQVTEPTHDVPFEEAGPTGMRCCECAAM